MRRIVFEHDPVKVLVDIPEDMFQELKKSLPDRWRHAVAALATQVVKNGVEDE